MKKYIIWGIKKLLLLKFWPAIRWLFITVYTFHVKYLSDELSHSHSYVVFGHRYQILVLACLMRGTCMYANFFQDESHGKQFNMLLRFQYHRISFAVPLIFDWRRNLAIVSHWQIKIIDFFPFLRIQLQNDDCAMWQRVGILLSSCELARLGDSELLLAAHAESGF